jgi:cyclophilin family peptidyl-prolyl cis-trans isomerase
VPRKTRHRQLARVAARRQAERRRRNRQRITVIAVALVVALIGGVLAFAAFTGSETPPAASGTPTPSASSTTQPVACGATAPADANKQPQEFAKPPPMNIDPNKTYTATLDTSCGTIVIQLLADQAPQTVNSFVFLAEKAYFDGTHFHRIDTNLDIIQGGDPTGTGSGGPGYTIPDELTGDESYGPGVVAMANSGQPNTGGSQFFIVYGPKGHSLESNAAYTIFGRVVNGLDVVKRIAKIPVPDPSAGLAGQQPTKTVYIDMVTVKVT